MQLDLKLITSNFKDGILFNLQVKRTSVFFTNFYFDCFPAIVPDIDEIAAQAETMFAGRYNLWSFTCLY